MTNEEIAKEIVIDHSILDYSDNFITRIHDKNLSKLIIEALNAKDKEIERIIKSRKGKYLPLGLQDRMPFGKHKGKKIVDIDINYLKYLKTVNFDDEVMSRLNLECLQQSCYGYFDY